MTMFFLISTVRCCGPKKDLKQQGSGKHCKVCCRILGERRFWIWDVGMAGTAGMLQSMVRFVSLELTCQKKMLQVARKMTKENTVVYQNTAIEDVDFPKESFDVVLSSLALHYVADFLKTAEKIYRILKPGGNFIFSCEHPVFTAEGSQEWYFGENKEILHFPVDHYFYEGKREANFLGEKVVKYHRTLTTYLRSLLKLGFQLVDVAEPQPPQEMLDLPGMQDEMRRPMMLIVSARRPQ